MEKKSIKSKLRSAKREGVKRVQNEIDEHRKRGGLRSVECSRGEPILAAEHRWDWGVLIPEEERQNGVDKKCGMSYKRSGGN